MSERSKAGSKQGGGRGAAAKPQGSTTGSADERAAASQPAERRPAELAKQQISRQRQKPSRTAS